MADTKVQAAAEHIAREVWTLRRGALRYDALHADTRAILEEVALKGACIGMVAAGLPAAPALPTPQD